MTSKRSSSSTSPETRVTILGCGTSTGVPLLFCTCRVCRSKNPKNHRTRASAWVQTQGKSFLIDTSIDLRQQALRERIPRVDAILFTHPHSDHVCGLDDVRAFNFIQKESIPAFGNAWTVSELNTRFGYVFSGKAKDEGGGLPRINLQQIEPSAGAFTAAGVSVLPIPLRHGSIECLAYRLGAMAYVTDCHEIPESSLNLLRGLDLLILDCLRLTPHGTHLHLEKSLEIIAEVRPKKTVLTHLGHDFEYAQWTARGSRAKLPRGVTLAYDGMKLRLPS